MSYRSIARTISASISISSNHEPIMKKISKTASDHNFNELCKTKIKPFSKGYPQFASQNQETVVSFSFGVSTMSLVSEMESDECPDSDQSIEDYYQELIKGDPYNSLLLGNYAKFLKEVKGDVMKAEE
ncbi:hypothetical protein K7X08_014939 [Anisodus acutangulus]|uniref:Uncharacterized protein n=1 Tax=Anisodus acutangulus TaxID=402998 RepID=A0A9Q1LKN6_9SOLA|nr:hypothetical protein K7X08_014939 [Anisodus acutangulus]